VSATLQGTVERITFVNEETQYVVARLLVPGRPHPATIVGTLPSLTPGETLRVHGTWTSHPKYGEQFAVERYEPVVPATLVGVERYLGSGLIKGIGPIFARRLVEAFGLETLRIIDEEPDRLREVGGIGPTRLMRITAAWSEQREVRGVMLFLREHDVSPVYAARIFKTYGQEAIATVRANPYRLARDVHGIGFASADRIARSMGIAADSPVRAAAGLLHVLAETVEGGHVFAWESELLRTAEADLAIPGTTLRASLEALIAAGDIVAESGAEGRALYLPELHAAEAEVAQRVAALLAAPQEARRPDVAAALDWVADATQLALAEEQQEAIRLALQAKCLAVTGGPGTGKTTILRCLLRILERHGVRVALTSPTGRAAKRLAETTGREAKTIHRLLEWGPRGAGFQRHAARPLEADLVIVDEASMIDLPLMRELLRAIPPRATLLLVGDADQLPSVGPGSVLRDLLEIAPLPRIRLTHIFRQAEESRIVRVAAQVHGGEVPDFSPADGSGAGDCYFVREEDPERLRELIVDLVARRLPARYGIDPIGDIQVLSPMHRGAVGATQLNLALQARLNPPGDAGREAVRGGRVLRVGDRVMQGRNNYEKEVYNGDIGRVVAVDPEEQTLSVDMDGRRVSYEFGELDELSLAYAATVHKSQGSEYPVVVLPIHTTHYPMLQRNLLYTGVTRARRLLVLAGTTKALALAVKNDRIQRRHSRLGNRLLTLLAQSRAIARESLTSDSSSG
jgi:exodeoxyribonuclease V alpha subunit